METIETDVLIIGGGIAGTMAAEALSREKQVTMVTKASWGESNSIKAQGGIAAAVVPEDHWRSHFEDTMAAGAGHNDEEATEQLAKQGIELVHRLIKFGVPFDQDSEGRFLLGMEGAHRNRRILHAGGDATGRAIMETLMKRVEPQTSLRESEMLVDLLVENGQCIGAVAKKNNNEIIVYKAGHTVLATGGAGGLYEVTSNDPTITGDGMAAAYRAGVPLADMEFVQFHPTMLVVDGQCGGLVSEAVRGEGARLVSGNGNKLMEGVHRQKDLAPRDVVARALHKAILSGEKVFLDISMIPDFAERFPTITASCEKFGIDEKNGRIPVTPGTHFMMGGIMTDGSGRTEMPGLYAIGETACTGVHGANRLASNSLLEAIVFASETARAILDNHRVVYTKPRDLSLSTGIEAALPSITEIQRQMTKHAGILREKQGLMEVESWLKGILAGVDGELAGRSMDEIERINMLTVGRLIASSALIRTESRGGHYRMDYPACDERKWRGKRIMRRPHRVWVRHTALFEQRETASSALLRYAKVHGYSVR